jgi:RNase P/RNase MRP subunit p29
MNLIGSRLKILSATDPSQVGKSGEVVLETSKTLILESDGSRLTAQKRGIVLQLVGTREVVRGDEILGRLEDRITRMS